MACQCSDVGSGVRIRKRGSFHRMGSGETSGVGFVKVELSALTSPFPLPFFCSLSSLEFTKVAPK